MVSNQLENKQDGLPIKRSLLFTLILNFNLKKNKLLMLNNVTKIEIPCSKILELLLL